MHGVVASGIPWLVEIAVAVAVAAAVTTCMTMRITQVCARGDLTRQECKYAESGMIHKLNLMLLKFSLKK